MFDPNLGNGEESKEPSVSFALSLSAQFEKNRILRAVQNTTDLRIAKGLAEKYVEAYFMQAASCQYFAQKALLGGMGSVLKEPFHNPTTGVEENLYEELLKDRPQEDVALKGNEGNEGNFNFPL